MARLSAALNRAALARLALSCAVATTLACDDGARRAGGPATGSRPDASGSGQPDTGAERDAGSTVRADAGETGRDASDPRPEPDAGVRAEDSGVTPAIVARTISAIQDPSDPGHPASGCTQVGATTTGQCARAELRGVVVTAVEGYVTRDLRALWVQDPGDGDGRFAGIKVVYRTGSPFPAIGQVVDIDGEVVEFQGNTQVRFATLTPTGGSGTIVPRVISPPSVISRSNPASAGEYEGTLVRVLGVTVVEACIDDASLRDFGYWTVTGDVQMGTAFLYGYNGEPRPGTVMCLDGSGNPTGLCSCAARSRLDDLRQAGDTFQSITGVMDFVFDTHVLQPRDANDLVR